LKFKKKKTKKEKESYQDRRNGSVKLLRTLMIKLSLVTE